jgi:hypothetical protein
MKNDGMKTDQPESSLEALLQRDLDAWLQARAAIEKARRADP